MEHTKLAVDICPTAVDLPNVNSGRKEAFVVVDPWSTGTKLCELIVSRNFELVLLWKEGEVRSTFHKARNVIIHNGGSLGDQESLKKLHVLNEEIHIKAIIPGSETGVLLAEKLAHEFGTPTNSPELALARRDKYHMGEAVRDAGVRAVKQIIATEWDHVDEFLSSWTPDPYKIVVKPNMGAGSDDVFLCESIGEVEKAFLKIMGCFNSLGMRNNGVLIQEFLSGKEYVVDTISCDGEHKVVQMWEYDKRHANGRFNVYFGMIPHVVDGELEHSLRAYVMTVLDALKVRNGPGHAEVIMTKTGPCLVEIGCRCHGGNAGWYEIAQACFGQDQVNAVVDAFSSPRKFRKLPEYCTKFGSYGRYVDLVAYDNKKIAAIPGIDFVKSLKSFHKIELFKGVGDTLDKTIDCNTTPGGIILIHEDKEQVDRDQEIIHEAVKNGEFFIFSDNEDYPEGKRSFASSLEISTDHDSVSSFDE